MAQKTEPHPAPPPPPTPDAETHPTNRTKIAHFLFAFPFSLRSLFLLFFRLHSFPCHFVNFIATAAQFSFAALLFFGVRH